MKIFGTKYFGHDSALAFLDFEKKKIFAISTERVTRIKHDSMDIEPILTSYDLPKPDYICHSFSGFQFGDQSWETKPCIIQDLKKSKIYRKSINPRYLKDLLISRKEKNSIFYSFLLKNPRIILEYLLIKFKFLLCKFFSKPEQTRQSVINYISLETGINKENVCLYDHHLCHAFASYVMSPFYGQSSLSLTIDGHGDGSFSKLYLISGGDITLLSNSVTEFISSRKENVTSIGEIYSNFTEALGFFRNSDEGKTEALAAFDKPNLDLLNDLERVTKIAESGISFDKSVVKFYDQTYLKKRIDEIGKESFASTIQTYLENTIIEFLDIVSSKYPDITKLCLSGGVAANIIMSLNIWERTKFKDIFILPAMGDEGTALGSAFLKAKDLNLDLSWLQKFELPYLGDKLKKEDIETALKKFESLIDWKYLGEKWPEKAAENVNNGEICGLVHGSMEFGPRALGNRSIVANPGISNVTKKINTLVKRRPEFQPFCPSILEEERNRLFEKSFSHKHMATAFRMKSKHKKFIPSAVHIDGTARPQFVSESDNQFFYRFLKKLKELNGYGVSINTSFNLHGRTIVRTAEDAIVDFLDCKLDTLFLEGYQVKTKNI